jgi:hypothetical protein
MSRRSLREPASRAGRRAQLSIWPQWRATLPTPAIDQPPAREQFASFGSGSWIVPPARITGAQHIDIGAGVIVMEHAAIRAYPMPGLDRAGGLLRLGNGVRLARFCTIWASVGVHIEADVLSSDYVAVVDCWREPGEGAVGSPVPDGAPVVIREGAYLGSGCIIGPGVTVGEGAYIGEGAVVMTDVAPHVVVYGNPARVTRTWTESGWQGSMFGQRL